MRWVLLGSVVLLLSLVGFVAYWLLGKPGQLETHIDPVPKSAPAMKPPLLPATVVTAMGGDASTAPARHPALTDTQNFLVAGLDRRPGSKGGGLTDTLIVVAIQPNTGQVGLISIPRDLYVEIPGHGMDRINVVYALAWHKGEKKPLLALKSVVEAVLVTQIEQVILIDLGVFERLVDTVGGVTVEVPCPIVDDFLDSRTPTGRRVLDVPAGQVKMDGPTVAMYVRSRHGRSDFSRARRQQAVLTGLHRRLLSLGGLGMLPAVWDAVDRSMATTMNRYQILALAQRALEVDSRHIHSLVFGATECRGFRTPDGKSVLVPDYAGIDSSLAKLFRLPPPEAKGPDSHCPPGDVALSRPRSPLDAGVGDAGVLAPPVSAPSASALP